jgi:hypothetical protein
VRIGTDRLDSIHANDTLDVAGWRKVVRGTLRKTLDHKTGSELFLARSYEAHSVNSKCSPMGKSIEIASTRCCNWAKRGIRHNR